MRMQRTWVEQVCPGGWIYSRLRDKKVFNLRDTCERVTYHASFWQDEIKPGGLGRYAVKYATKKHQKKVPDFIRHTGRFWGCSRNITLPEPIRFTGGEAEVREAIASMGRDVTAYDYLPKYIWVDSEVTERLKKRMES